MNEQSPRNETLDNLLLQLERVTSLNPACLSDVDEDSATLRESWSRWTQLCEAVDRESDDADFVFRLQRPASRSKWLLLAGASLAASLLLAAVVGWLVTRPLTAKPQIADGFAQSRVQTDKPEPSPVLPTPTPVSNSDGLAWDDTLDQRLAAASRALSDLRYVSLVNDQNYANFSERLQQLQQELEAGSL